VLVVLVSITANRQELFRISGMPKAAQSAVKLLVIAVALLGWCLLIWVLMSVGHPIKGRLYTRNGKHVLVRDCARCDSIHVQKKRLGVTFK